MCGNIKLTACDCQDWFYDLIVTTKEITQELSEHTYTMFMQRVDIGEYLDEFVQKRSRWVIDRMGICVEVSPGAHAGWYAPCPHTPSAPRIFPRDNFFNGVINPHGFRSTWHTIGLGLAHTLFYNMMLYTIEDYKNSIRTTTCTEEDLAKAFKAHYPTTRYSRWSASTFNYKSTSRDGTF